MKKSFTLGRVMAALEVLEAYGQSRSAVVLKSAAIIREYLDANPVGHAGVDTGRLKSNGSDESDRSDKKNAEAALPYNSRTKEQERARREVEPKLTLKALAERDIKWPEWAKCAILYANGKAYFCRYNELSTTGSGGWILDFPAPFGETVEPIPGKWDASEWPDIPLERPKKLNYEF